jgi:hypothetical protein
MPASRKSRAKKAGAAPRKMIEVRTPNKPGYVSRVDAAKYEAMRKVMMKVLPRRAPGMTQAEMWNALAKAAPKSEFPDRGKVGWWMKSVQLDLEARRMLVREDTRPLRWHLKK